MWWNCSCKSNLPWSPPPPRWFHLIADFTYNCNGRAYMYNFPSGWEHIRTHRSKTWLLSRLARTAQIWQEHCHHEQVVFFDFFYNGFCSKLCFSLDKISITLLQSNSRLSFIYRVRILFLQCLNCNYLLPCLYKQSYIMANMPTRFHIGKIPLRPYSSERGFL